MGMGDENTRANIGLRHERQLAALDSVAAYIEQEFVSLGYTVTRIPFVADGKSFRRVEITMTGRGEVTGEIGVVGHATTPFRFHDVMGSRQCAHAAMTRLGSRSPLHRRAMRTRPTAIRATISSLTTTMANSACWRISWPAHSS